MDLVKSPLSIHVIAIEKVIVSTLAIATKKVIAFMHVIATEKVIASTQNNSCLQFTLANSILRSLQKL